MPSDFIPTPPKKRSYPTPAQFAVLVLFYKYHRRMNGRTKRPSMRDVGREFNFAHVVALGHMQALQRRGLLIQRRKWERRGWELTEKGLARAEKKWKLLEKRRKAREAADRERRREAKNWRKRMRERREKHGH
jgi:predicted transcriptional regulator